MNINLDQIFIEQCHRCIQTSNYFNCATINSWQHLAKPGHWHWKSSSSSSPFSSPHRRCCHHHRCRKFSHRHVRDSSVAILKLPLSDPIQNIIIFSSVSCSILHPTRRPIVLSNPLIALRCDIRLRRRSFVSVLKQEMWNNDIIITLYSSSSLWYI